jgi:hypothetical protein
VVRQVHLSGSPSCAFMAPEALLFLNKNTMHTEIKPDGQMWKVIVQPDGEAAYFASESDAMRFAFSHPSPPTPISHPGSRLQCTSANEVWRPGGGNGNPDWSDARPDSFPAAEKAV